MDLKKILSSALESRCQKNAKYSLRAFARDLGVPPPRLSRWLKGKDGLSRTSSRQLAKKLNLSKPETDAFILAMESQYARSKKIRDLAKKKLKTLQKEYTPVNSESFRVIEDWYNLAVLALIETEGFVADPEWIARRLDISIYEAQGALQRLSDLKMIECSQNALKPTGVYFANPGGVPSKSVRKFHGQIIEKAKAALELQTVDERDFSNLILAVRKDKIEEAKVFVKNFRDAFEAKFCAGTDHKNEVYSLNVQFFRLTKNSEVLKGDKKI